MSDQEDEDDSSSEHDEQKTTDVALAIMLNRGELEEPDDELIAALRRLYHSDPVCRIPIRFSGEILHDMAAARPAEHLIALFEQECEERWEREEAERWSCPCGFTFGLYPWYAEKVSFYTLAETGVFHTLVEECPRCTRDLAKTRAELTEGQLGFAF